MNSFEMLQFKKAIKSGKNIIEVLSA